MRRTAVLIHRWAGLAMAGFLLVAGLSGAVLAWYHELDALVNPGLTHAPAPAPGVVPLDPLTLRERVQAAYPEAWVHGVKLRAEPGHAATFWIEGAADPITGVHAEIPNDEIFLDPMSGEILGERKWGDLGQGVTNLVPFLYRLHYSLALGTFGAYVLGIVALAWTIDCCVGAWLTFPARRRNGQGAGASGCGWWARWRPAWGVRWRGGSYKVNYDLHRAGGLWPWAMLFVLAWSSVAFNLKDVYNPVMRTLFHTQPEVPESVPKLAVDAPEPAMGWREGLAWGRAWMAVVAGEKDFTVLAEDLFSYDPHRGLFRYRVQSDRDVAEKWGSTSVWFDAGTGALRATWIPTGEAAGDTVSSWLLALHVAAIWGLPFKIFVSLVGIVVALLSVTGMVIWWRKRRGRAGLIVGRSSPADPNRRREPTDRSSRGERSACSAAHGCGVRQSPR
jgi:uncharacterized iron-regulated membrane protein